MTLKARNNVEVAVLEVQSQLDSIIENHKEFFDRPAYFYWEVADLLGVDTDKAGQRFLLGLVIRRVISLKCMTRIRIFGCTLYYSVALRREIIARSIENFQGVDGFLDMPLRFAIAIPEIEWDEFIVPVYRSGIGKEERKPVITTRRGELCLRVNSHR